MYTEYQIPIDTLRMEKDLHPDYISNRPEYKYKGRLTVKEGKVVGILTLCGAEKINL